MFSSASIGVYLRLKRSLQFPVDSSQLRICVNRRNLRLKGSRRFSVERPYLSHCLCVPLCPLRLKSSCQFPVDSSQLEICVNQKIVALRSQ